MRYMLAFVVVVGLALGAAASPAMLGELNQERTSRGLSALTDDPGLSAIAQAHAEAMADAETVLPGTDLYGGGNTLDSLVSAFMVSPSHKAKVLGDYSHAGTGMATGADGKIYLAAIFAQRTPTTTTTMPVVTTTQPPVTTTTTVPIPPTTENIALRASERPLMDDSESVPTLDMALEDRWYLCGTGLTVRGSW